MRASAPLSLALLALAAACAESPAAGADEIVLPVFARGESHHFVSPLAGRNEVPPVDTRASGNAVFRLSDDGSELHYRLITAGLRNTTQAHIHLAPAGQNGPVVVFLFGFVAGGVTQNGILAEGTLTGSELIARPAIGFGGTMEELVAAMRGGGAYVNVHTVAVPSGEIRGQVAETGPTR